MLKPSSQFHHSIDGLLSIIMERQPNTDEVAKMEMDNDILQHVKSFTEALICSELHMYSGNDDAYYVENSNSQRNVFHVLRPLFEAALSLHFPRRVLSELQSLGVQPVQTRFQTFILLSTYKSVWEWPWPGLNARAEG